MDWNKLKAFYEVALNNSISKASINLNISQFGLIIWNVAYKDKALH